MKHCTPPRRPLVAVGVTYAGIAAGRETAGQRRRRNAGVDSARRGERFACRQPALRILQAILTAFVGGSSGVGSTISQWGVTTPPGIAKGHAMWNWFTFVTLFAAALGVVALFHASFLLSKWRWAWRRVRWLERCWEQEKKSALQAWEQKRNPQ